MVKRTNSRKLLRTSYDQSCATVKVILTFEVNFSGQETLKFDKNRNYKKRVVVHKKSNLLLKIFCKTFKHYNY